jgi:hypothetical protein
MVVKDGNDDDLVKWQEISLIDKSFLRFPSSHWNERRDERGNKHNLSYYSRNIAEQISFNCSVRNQESDF